MARQSAKSSWGKLAGVHELIAIRGQLDEDYARLAPKAACSSTVGGDVQTAR